MVELSEVRPPPGLEPPTPSTPGKPVRPRTRAGSRHRGKPVTLHKAVPQSQWSAGQPAERPDATRAWSSDPSGLYAWQMQLQMQMQLQYQFLQQHQLQQDALILSAVLAQQREAAASALERFALAAEIHAAADEPPTETGHGVAGSHPEVPVVSALAPQPDGELAEQTTMASPLSETPESREVSACAPHAEDGGVLEVTEPVLTLDARRFLGTIKSYNTLQGFGFIQSLEVKKLYGCDVFLNQHVEGGVVVGGLVSFSVEVNAGRPQARHVTLQERKPPIDANIAGVGRTYGGRVKSYNASRGFGFITCPELPQVFRGQDIYVAKSHVSGGDLSAGREVEFRLTLDRQGHPQAREVTSVRPTQAR
eukprot:CAMPEP_0194513954 /NCGR_PEP_ID=MMETSP0253-20130528/46266_1 /TAXON_ID=2966 /ORGANISM="Noctiluca scintillans" /LENGTH=364 /DNA_ID=CAMNT_0039357553 /DNA_START=1 /DNA_END=1095 /DNA_ORIENTATION=-